MNDEEKEEILLDVVEHSEYLNVKHLLEFDEDLFRFGGDLSLDEEEKRILELMNQIKQENDAALAKESNKKQETPKTEKTQKKEKKQHKRASEQMDPKKAEELSSKLKKKLQKLEESKAWHYWVIGGVIISAIIGGVFIYRYKPKNRKQTAKDIEEEAKAKEYLETQNKEIKRQLGIAKKMKDILREKFEEINQIDIYDKLESMTIEQLNELLGIKSEKEETNEETQEQAQNQDTKEKEDIEQKPGLELKIKKD